MHLSMHRPRASAIARLTSPGKPAFPPAQEHRVSWAAAHFQGDLRRARQAGGGISKVPLHAECIGPGPGLAPAQYHPGCAVADKYGLEEMSRGREGKDFVRENGAEHAHGENKKRSCQSRQRRPPRVEPRPAVLAPRDQAAAARRACHSRPRARTSVRGPAGRRQRGRHCAAGRTSS